MEYLDELNEILRAIRLAHEHWQPPEFDLVVNENLIVGQLICTSDSADVHYLAALCLQVTENCEYSRYNLLCQMIKYDVLLKPQFNH